MIDRFDDRRDKNLGHQASLTQCLHYPNLIYIYIYIEEEEEEEEEEEKEKEEEEEEEEEEDHPKGRIQS